MKDQSDEERGSEGDFIDINEIIVLPDDLDKNFKSKRLDRVGTVGQLSRPLKEEILRRRLEPEGGLESADFFSLQKKQIEKKD
jgi:hypothetical protein